MKVNEMLEILSACVPIENGFLNEETGEIFTDEQMRKIEENLDVAIDRIGMFVLETEKRAESKKALADHYREEAKREEARIERLKFYLGYLTEGKKKKCEHVTISYFGKQERLALRCKDSQVPREFCKEIKTYKPDTTLIRAELENKNPAVAEFAYIDTRKKASVK